YYDFALETSLAVLGYDGSTNFWSIEKYMIGIVSLIIIVAIIFLINKFSKENIKKEFTKGSA
ncbi:MAG: hypothetical protein IH618_11315, partial [Ignavibacteriaceae bacterium]|nr:hypothetical protein [Ignavibacteriaceae bacterium]